MDFRNDVGGGPSKRPSSSQAFAPYPLMSISQPYNSEFHYRPNSASAFHSHEDYRHHQSTASLQSTPLQSTEADSRSKVQKLTCLYCDKRLPEVIHKKHCFECHWQLEFRCGLCNIVHFSHLKSILTHLKSVHKESSLNDFVALVNRGVLVLPSDLRSLNCRLCEGKKVLLAQDRMALASHIKHRHGLNLPKHVLKYTCRLCCKDFARSAEMMGHNCCHLSSTSFIEDRPQLNPYMIPMIQNKVEEKEACLYCDKMMSKSTKASHRGRHWDLDFQCAKCPRSFSFLTDVRKHWQEMHANVQNPEEIWDMKNARQMADKGLLIMPKDLRILKCTVCSKVFLAQDRLALCKHVETDHHSDVSVDKSEVYYGCRSCDRHDFENSSAVFRHACFDNKTDSVVRLSKEEVDVEEDQLLDLSNIEWKGDTYVIGDLRRLACKLCGVQIHGKKFFKMIEHLETEHDKFQLSRALQMDVYVRFGCGNCDRFQPDNVHLWDRHFANENCTKCKAMGVLKDDEAFITTSRGDEPRETNMETREDKMEINKSTSEDIRKMKCTLCGFEINGTDYLEMQDHLRLVHTKETIRLTKLDHLVEFGCAKCPEYKENRVSTWKQHFYKSFASCRDSYRRDMVVLEFEDSNPREGDLRQLKCGLCSHKCDGVRFVVMCRHLETKHGNQSETNVDFGCHNCPRFRPDSVIRWDRHFSSDFLQCQGSAKIGKRRILYWCDACRETREDIDTHFLGPSHKASVEGLSKPVPGETPVQIVTCDACNIGFATSPNYLLHCQGSHHQNQIRESEGTSLIFDQ